ncbi:hypothetical protein D9F39_25490, partial [Escherichia coli]|nr:hypothetical protein [Escherichia coli]
SLAEGTQLDADITALNALNSAANPTTVLALLASLEAAEKRIAEVRVYNVDLAEESRQYQQRVAELEARELVVNLPAYVDGRTLGYGEVNHMIDLCADAIEKAGHSAGIITKVGGG